VTAPAEISGLSNAELQQLVLKLLGENTEQKRAIVELREEIGATEGLERSPRYQAEWHGAGNDA